MTSEVKAGRRRYHSPLRADQAVRTRRRVLDSALQLFVAHGYAGTTVAAVAEHARVSPETIYVALGGKRGLLEGVIEVAITGPEDAPDVDAAWWSRVAELPSAAERLDRMVDFSCRILARTAPIHAIIRGAADKEAFAAALGRRLLNERLAAQTERIRVYLRGDLRPGLSVEEAGQRYCALVSPELFYVLTAEFAWTAEQHRSWLTRLLQLELLGPASDGPRPVGPVAAAGP